MGKGMNWGKTAQTSRMQSRGYESTAASPQGDSKGPWTHVKRAPAYRVGSDGSRTLIDQKAEAASPRGGDAWRTIVEVGTLASRNGKQVRVEWKAIGHNVFLAVSRYAMGSGGGRWYPETSIVFRKDEAGELLALLGKALDGR